MQLVIRNLSRSEILEYAKKNGNEAVLYTDECALCERTYRVYAYTALACFKRDRQFVPPKQCKRCYSSIRNGKHKMPRLRKVKEHLKEIQPVRVCLLCYRKNPIDDSFCECGYGLDGTACTFGKLAWDKSLAGAIELEGKLVTFRFEEEQLSGIVVGFSSYGLTIADGLDKESIMFARTYTHSVVDSIVVQGDGETTSIDRK